MTYDICDNIDKTTKCFLCAWAACKLWTKYISPANDHVFAAKAYSPEELSSIMGRSMYCKEYISHNMINDHVYVCMYASI